MWTYNRRDWKDEKVVWSVMRMGWKDTFYIEADEEMVRVIVKLLNFGEEIRMDLLRYR